MNTEEFEITSTDSPPLFRRRAYQAVSAMSSDDHKYERGVDAARAVAHAVHTELGARLGWPRWWSSCR